ncbi:hypothetical protein MBGDF03_01224 [Thermoplasmatales archaeon SCGC AB-540-F20]|nr:hypothetical protein MBGDF03_01224 [Thermoplasmatales archaeon SCGC AB-540-F20]
MKNKQRTILCVLIATVFLMLLMGNTALADDDTYYFDNYDTEAAWEHTPEDMVDGSENTFAGTNQSATQLCDDNSYSSGEPGTITKVEIRAKASYSINQAPLILQPIFDGVNGAEYNFTNPPEHPNANWSDWFDITGDEMGPGVDRWEWTDIATLDCNVTARYVGSFELHCSIVQLLVTYTPVEVHDKKTEDKKRGKQKKLFPSSIF